MGRGWSGHSVLKDRATVGADALVDCQRIADCKHRGKCCHDVGDNSGTPRQIHGLLLLFLMVYDSHIAWHKAAD